MCVCVCVCVRACMYVCRIAPPLIIRRTNLGYMKKMILTILILHVVEMSNIYCHLKPTHGFGGDVEKCEKLATVCRMHGQTPHSIS